MADTPQVLLAHHLKTLKLPTFLREYDKLARQCATEGADHVRYLVRLTELELIDRERRMVERRIRQARFPAVKSLDSFDFKAIASLNKMLVLELARCEYVERRENIIALGNSGTGKTHIALGLGLAACQKGLSVGFLTAAALVHELMEARDEKRLLRLQKQLAKYHLLIIDELGFLLWTTGTTPQHRVPHNVKWTSFAPPGWTNFAPPLTHTTGVNCIRAEWQHAQATALGFQHLPTTKSCKSRPLELLLVYI